MPKQIALVGSLVDVRNYAQSKSVRLIIEIPAEQAASVISEFGWATPVAPVSVAVARLDLAKATPEPPVAQERPRRWDELAASAQAAIRCEATSFRHFLTQRFGRIVLVGPDDAAALVREHCGVDSRKEMTPGSDAAAIWRNLDGDYEAWLRYGATA